MMENIAMKKLIKPVHPGKILLKEFLEPMGINQNKLAKNINVPMEHIEKIIKGKCTVTEDIASQLGLFFGMSASFWLGLQKDYELDTA